ncbi:RNA polymerase sigma-54 factor [bacterium HR21]|nr:RNA polymerase sigma-54 factor [bacterium HR21]
MAQQKLQLTQQLKQQLRLSPALLLQQGLFQNLLSLSNEEAYEELFALMGENPYLEEAPTADTEEDTGEDLVSEPESAEQLRTEEVTAYDTLQDPFAFYSMFWHPHPSSPSEGEEDEDDDALAPAAQPSFHEALVDQLWMLNLSPEERILAEEIIGSLDLDGYLREALDTVLQRANARIAELNAERLAASNRQAEAENPARRYALDPIAAHLVLHRELPAVSLLKPLTIEQAEQLLHRLQRELDPPGIGARSLQECLLAQLESRPLRTEAEQWAHRILKEAFPELTRRTWREVLKHFQGTLSPEMLTKAFEVIRHLNPRPGAGAPQELPLQVLPDFIVERDPESGELTITLNDGVLPTLRLNPILSRLKRLPRKSSHRTVPEPARKVLRQDYLTAHTLLSVLRQRKETLLRVMAAIVKLQRDFFEHGPQHLKPMIYADIARETGLDTSTICRAVANKYVQTDFGIFALKDLFTEALPSTESGEGVSVEVVKQKLRELLEAEDPNNPLSDIQLARKLQEMGYKIARRTVAKYREELGFPPIWKRKALQ